MSNRVTECVYVLQTQAVIDTWSFWPVCLSKGHVEFNIDAFAVPPCTHTGEAPIAGSSMISRLSVPNISRRYSSSDTPVTCHGSVIDLNFHQHESSSCKSVCETRQFHDLLEIMTILSNRGRCFVKVQKKKLAWSAYGKTVLKCSVQCFTGPSILFIDIQMLCQHCCFYFTEACTQPVDYMKRFIGYPVLCTG